MHGGMELDGRGCVSRGGFGYEGGEMEWDGLQGGGAARGEYMFLFHV